MTNLTKDDAERGAEETRRQSLRCLFGFHTWSPWYPWWRDSPRIVFASDEYRNDPTEYSNCEHCPKLRKRNPYKNGIKAS